MNLLLLLGGAVVAASNDELPIGSYSWLQTHNSYHLRTQQWIPSWYYEHESLTNQLNAGVRGFELDMHDLDHVPIFHEPVDKESNCATLGLCLGELKQWSADNPDHFPISVVLQPKGDFSKERLDESAKIIRETLDGMLFAPEQNVCHVPFGRIAVSGLRGKIYFVILTDELTYEDTAEDRPWFNSCVKAKDEEPAEGCDFIRFSLREDAPTKEYPDSILRARTDVDLFQDPAYTFEGDYATGTVTDPEGVTRTIKDWNAEKLFHMWDLDNSGSVSRLEVGSVHGIQKTVDGLWLGVLQRPQNEDLDTDAIKAILESPRFTKTVQTTNPDLVSTVLPHYDLDAAAINRDRVLASKPNIVSTDYYDTSLPYHVRLADLDEQVVISWPDRKARDHLNCSESEESGEGGTRADMMDLCAAVAANGSCEENCQYAFSDKDLSLLIPDSLTMEICTGEAGSYMELCPDECEEKDFWTDVYDGTALSYQTYCAVWGANNKANCKACGGRYHNRRGDCYIQKKVNKIKCKKMSSDICQHVGCRFKGGKCQGRPKFS